ncbi:hypothetical protein PhCBS80983_g05852 [Powellomyces hirtus]|uniref:Reverse transcriptase domain-containing protein n=1 Tax=Powellomyces hirtus TaxID=109895 RepID=A0A507DTQ7_9FUNG|nr:hypothetical protein PhCBS80983_g05852 [Powellomyces hirtus]
MFRPSTPTQKPLISNFRCRYGLFEYNVMPFGLSNAPGVFQYLMNDIFRDILNVFVVVYLDDILIFSQNPEDHPKHVRAVLSRLRHHGLYAKPEKCEFNHESVEFLGFIISENGIQMDPKKIAAITDWEPPTNVKGIQRFLGFANFYRRFIQGYSKIAAPLTSLTRKELPFKWTAVAQAAFDALKKAFTSAPILVHPDPEKPFFVETDASDFAIGAVLLQPDGQRQLHPVAFHSSTPSRRPLPLLRIRAKRGEEAFRSQETTILTPDRLCLATTFLTPLDSSLLDRIKAACMSDDFAKTIRKQLKIPESQ